MAKYKKRDKDKEPEIPDSTKDEVFIHQALWNMGADEEEAVAFANIFGNMIESIAKEIKADIKKELKAQKWVIISVGGAISVLLAIVTLFLAILTFFRDSVG